MPAKTDVALTPGTRLGPYEIQSALGAGGMGEVYRARDSRLDRTVAVKVLPSYVASDPTLKQRFEREARTLAALSHPHICPVFDVGQHDGIDFLVMEYLDGETLADRLVKGPLPLDQALRYAIEIADALDKAHRRGIVHRDLKPGNIMLTRSGGRSGPPIAKLLDFGLAKLQPAGAVAGPSMAATVTAPLTGHGTILGTLQYMAPEQLEGKDADARTDIFAFGALLYEMLTGKRAFEGTSQASLISAIMSADPRPLSASQPLAPPPLDHLVQRCLAKDPDERWQTASDVMRELRWIAGHSAQPSSSAPVKLKRSRARLAWTGVSVLVLASTMFVAGTRWNEVRDATPAQWRGERLGGSTVAMGPRASPDGQTLAFQAMADGQTQVAVMKPQSGNWTILTRDRSRGAIATISWSRDGTELFFDRILDGPGGIFTVPVLGGEERIVLEDAMGPEQLPDGSLLVTRINADHVWQLHRFWPETGRLEALPALPSASPLFPAVRVFPDGREAVFFGRPLEGTQTADHLHVIDLTSGRVRRIVPTVSISPPSWSFPLTVTQDGGSVLFDLPSGNLHRIVAVPRDGSEQVRQIVTLTELPLFLDIGPDGSLYVDQIDQPADLLRFSPASGALERIPLPNVSGTEPSTLPLPDGRVLLTGRIVGRDQVMVMAPGKDPVPFVATDEETTGPLAMVGEDEFVFVAGTVPARTLALASVADGRITRRLTRVDAGAIQGMAGSPDGTTIFYVDSGTVWSVPAGDGEPRKIRGGNGVAVDPRRRDLLIMLNEPAGKRLIRVPISGGSEQIVPLPSDLRLSPTALSGNAIGTDGRIAVRVAPIDSWFWPAAIFDPATGRVERIPGGDQADMPSPGWANDGRLVTVASRAQASLWRFRPENEAR